jgi:hypothetical protein
VQDSSSSTLCEPDLIALGETVVYKLPSTIQACLTELPRCDYSKVGDGIVHDVLEDFSR